MQQKFVNGTLTDADNSIINTAYYDLMTSFVERNGSQHPAYMLTTSPCNPNDTACEDNQIAPTYQRVPAGLAFKLVAPDAPGASIPPEPDYKTEGITRNPVAFDDAARINSLFYVNAYNRMAIYFGALSQPDAARRMSAKATSLQAIINSR